MVYADATALALAVSPGHRSRFHRPDGVSTIEKRESTVDPLPVPMFQQQAASPSKTKTVKDPPPSDGALNVGDVSAGALHTMAYVTGARHVVTYGKDNVLSLRCALRMALLGSQGYCFPNSKRSQAVTPEGRLGVPTVPRTIHNSDRWISGGQH